MAIGIRQNLTMVGIQLSPSFSTFRSYIRLSSFYTFVTTLSMSDTPYQPPFTPSSVSNVNLQYNDAGNPYHQDEYGQWVPHTGFVQVHGIMIFCSSPAHVYVSQVDHLSASAFGAPHDNSRNGPNAPISDVFVVRLTCRSCVVYY